MKLAIVDLSFHWPPQGGSWVEVAEVARRLPRWGVETVVIVPKVTTGDMHRGLVQEDPGVLVEAVPTDPRDFHWRRLPDVLANAVRRAGADRVWVTNAFSMGPAVLSGLAQWPTVWKVFGYEVLCPNYMSLHADASISSWHIDNPRGEVCGRSYFDSPYRCTACAVRGMGRALLPGAVNSYSREWLASGAWLPGYARRARRAIAACLGVMVYSDPARSMLTDIAPRTRIVPGGVDTELFRPTAKRPDDVIVMAGRADDPRKGLDVFVRAIGRLRSEGWSGRALATTARTGEIAPGVEGTGWIPYREMRDLYARTKVVVVPTLWPEPFGLVAVEAMACGRPVVASDIGGLSLTVGKTGLAFPPGDDCALSRALRALLADEAAWAAAGEQAREVAKAYAWDDVVEHYHLPSLAGGASWWA